MQLELFTPYFIEASALHVGKDVQFEHFNGSQYKTLKQAHTYCGNK
jgi:hypothetical protein